MATKINIRPEDKPKVIAIVGVIVFVNIFVFSRLISGAQTPPAGDTTKTTSTSSTTQTPAAESGTATTTAVAKAPVVPVAGGDMKVWNKDETQPTPPSGDPFKPVIDTASSVPLESRHAPQASNIALKLPPILGKRYRLASAVSRMMSKGILPPIGMNLQVRPTKQEEPLPEFEVKGVIIDDQAMVVLRMGDKSLYKTVGESLQGGIIIEKVTQEAVTFRIGNERRVLAPGQTFKATEIPSYTTTNQSF